MLEISIFSMGLHTVFLFLSIEHDAFLHLLMMPGRITDILDTLINRFIGTLIMNRNLSIIGFLVALLQEVKLLVDWDFPVHIPSIKKETTLLSRVAVTLIICIYIYTNTIKIGIYGWLEAQQTQDYQLQTTSLANIWEFLGLQTILSFFKDTSYCVVFLKCI